MVGSSTLPSSRRSCTHTCGTPVRSLMNAICSACGLRVGPQLPQASHQLRAEVATAAVDACRASAGRADHEPHAQMPWCCSHISSSASCHRALEPRVVRVVFGSASMPLDRLGPEQAALLGRRIGQGVADPLQVGTLELADGRHREVALGPVDHLVRHDARGRPA